MEACKSTLSGRTTGKSEEAGDQHQGGTVAKQRRRAGAKKAKQPAASGVVKQGVLAEESAGGGGGNKSKRRLTKGEIKGILALKPEPLPSDNYPEGLAEFFPPDWIEKKRRQQEEELAILRKIDDNHEEFRQKVIKGLKEKGYYEVDEDYLNAREEANEHARQHVRKPFANIDPSDLRRRVSTPEEERQWHQGNGYVLDSEDARFISCGDDDFVSDAEEEEGGLAG